MFESPEWTIEIPDRNPRLDHEAVVAAYQTIADELTRPICNILRDKVGQYLVTIGAGFSNPDGLPLVAVTVTSTDEGANDSRSAVIMGVAVDDAKETILDCVIRLVNVLEQQAHVIAAALARQGLTLVLDGILADMYDVED